MFAIDQTKGILLLLRVSDKGNGDCAELGYRNTISVIVLIVGKHSARDLPKVKTRPLYYATIIGRFFDIV